MERALAALAAMPSGAAEDGRLPLAVVEAPRATDIVAPTPVDLDAPDAQPVTDLRAPDLPGKPAAAYPGVVVLVHAPEKPADLDLSMAGTLVGTAGFPIGRAVTVPFTVSATNVRYYHAEDAAAAAAIAKLVNGEARDFTHSGSTAGPGSVGTAKAAAKSKSAKKAKAARVTITPEEALKRALHNKLVRVLKGKDNL